MAYYRRLPSGLWQATVRGRDGKRHTRTDKLKSVVKQWAIQQEATIARGECRDPRLGHIMSQLYTAAMREHPPIVLVNPFDHLELPKIEPRAVEFLEHEEAEALYTAAEAIGAHWRTLIELGTEVGLRPGEIYGLHGHRVDWLRSQIQVIDVMTRRGLRQWPKSKKSHRIVPVPAHILEGMSALMAGRARDA